MENPNKIFIMMRDITKCYLMIFLFFKNIKEL